MSHQLAFLTIALYAASCACYLWFLYAPHQWLGRTATLLLACGIASQYFALLERSQWIHSVPYDDLYGSMSLFAWLLGITYLGLETYHRQRSVGAFVSLLLTAWMVALPVIAPRAALTPPPAHGALFAFHVTLNTWSYAAFALSFVLSVIYIVQNALLRTRRLSAPFWRLPALDVLDRMARSSVYIGLLALCLGVVMVLVLRQPASESYSWSDPKVIVTFAILVVYIVYLWLSRSTTWRGSRAAIVCAINFLIVLFSYTFVNRYLTSFHRFY